jgi:hypothetical protein
MRGGAGRSREGGREHPRAAYRKDVPVRTAEAGMRRSAGILAGAAFPLALAGRRPKTLFGAPRRGARRTGSPRVLLRRRLGCGAPAAGSLAASDQRREDAQEDSPCQLAEAAEVGPISRARPRNNEIVVDFGPLSNQGAPRYALRTHSSQHREVPYARPTRVAQTRNLGRCDR